MSNGRTDDGSGGSTLFVQASCVTPRGSSSWSTKFAASSHMDTADLSKVALVCLARYYEDFLERFQQEPPTDDDDLREQLDAFDVYVAAHDRRLHNYALDNDMLERAISNWKAVSIPAKFLTPRSKQ
jgi:hypothetical protein